MTSLRGSVGPYRLLEEIGVGGMGEVHLALDPDGRTVAVKILHPAVARDAVARRRLAREVATMRRVRSPYVAEVLDAGFTVRRPYIVTRYVPGRALDVRVRATGPVRGRALPVLARRLVRALHAVHSAGIVHRDLKPGNVVLVDDLPVVIDFGLAHMLDATRLTRTGTAVGTPGYLAPEVLDGERAGPAADVFSWGATVAFAARGRSPYGAGPAQAVFSRVLRGRYDLDGVPAGLRPLVAAALDLDPGARPDTGDLLETLAVGARDGTRRPRAARSATPAGAVTRRSGPSVRDDRAAVRDDGGADDAPRAAGEPGAPVRPGRTGAPARRPAPPVDVKAVLNPALDTSADPGPNAALDGDLDPGVNPGPDAGLDPGLDPRLARRSDPDPDLDPGLDPDAGGQGRSPLRMAGGALRALLALAFPAACYALPVVALVTVLAACVGGYAWDALARARRRVAARHGPLARLGALLVAVVAAPAQAALRLVALVLALAAGYGLVLAVTWWSVVPQGRALALPLGVLAAVAALVRAGYSGRRRPARLVAAVAAAVLLVPVVLGVPAPAWWPFVPP